MNIFFLDHDVKTCAKMHADKHVVKMILEYAQLLSTAHRVLDGTQSTGLSATGRKQTRYVLSDSRESIMYSATHINHPSAVWVRKSVLNYDWLHRLLVELCKEYTYRYGKVHKCEATGLVQSLGNVPLNLNPLIGSFTEPTPAMPDDVIIVGNAVSSYRNYYIKHKQHLASWKGKVNSRNTPEWFHANV